MKNKGFTVLIEYTGIILGCALIALGLVLFLAPNTIAPGGVTGLSVVIQEVSHIPIDAINLIINIPLFIIALFVLGSTFGVKTIFATITLSALIRLFIIIFGDSYVLTSDLLLSAVYGGVIVGAGIGFVFRSGGTTGGTDVAGAIINKYYPHFSVAKSMMMLDLVIVIIAGIIVKNIEISLYSVVALYIIVHMADFVIEGLNYSKAFYIISNYPDEIGRKINLELDRGVTILEGRGFYTGEQKDVLLCVVNRAQVAKLKKLVHEIDGDAFIMVTTIHEVLGEGFKQIENKR
ncbi:MAG TPA: YitT family protein [Clostridia bacterium]|nr:YitT family protein [Clostridia bacterium]